MSVLERQAINNRILRQFEEDEVDRITVGEGEERIVKPLPSPGVVRRGSIEGLLVRSSALRLQREKSNQTLANSEAGKEDEELEIMRHFEAVDKKVFNRGDSHSFRRRDRGERRMARFLSEDETEDPSKTYKVCFLGASSVGKGGLHLIFLCYKRDNFFQINGICH